MRGVRVGVALTSVMVSTKKLSVLSDRSAPTLARTSRTLEMLAESAGLATCTTRAECACSRFLPLSRCFIVLRAGAFHVGILAPLDPEPEWRL